MKRILLLSSLIFCSFPLLFSQAPTLPLDALCSDDGGNYAITANPSFSSNGSAYIYERQTTSWQLVQTLKPTDGNPLAGPLGFRANLFTDPQANVDVILFGQEVTLMGDLAYVSFQISGDLGPTSFASFGTYQTYVYQRLGSTWTLVNQLMGGFRLDIDRDNVALINREVFSTGLSELLFTGTIYELDAMGQTLFSQELFDYSFSDQNGLGLGLPNFDIHVSPNEDLVVTSASGDPAFLGNTPISAYERGASNWSLEVGILPIGSDPASRIFPFKVNYVEQSSIVLSNGDTYVKQSPGNWTLGSLPQALLSLDGSRAFLPKLSLPIHTDEDEFILYRRIGGGSFQAIATLCRNTQTYTDTLMVFGQNIDYYCESVYNEVPSFTNPSNTVTYSLPATIQPLQLNYVCYDPTSDSLTWSVFNPNAQDHPFIYAQWWNAQRDTLYAQAGGNVTFKTKNNPQNPATFGDDNITGIWWIDQNLTPGQPNDLVFNIPLSVNCSGSRIAQSTPAAKAGNIFSGGLSHFMSTEMDIEKYLTDQVQIGPNPVAHTLSIRGLQVEGQGTLKVLNMLGQVVMETSFDVQPEVNLDMESLAKGTYLLDIRTPMGNVRQKLVKN
ncbi:MAG: T9SS type A sorting domain-containing protein [Bacteroidota bacterium]